MNNLNTFKDIEIKDPLISKQKEDVSKMRASLLACSDDSNLIRNSIKNITVLRIYHQLSRVIRYLDMMDKLESKMYEALDNTIETSNAADPSTVLLLLQVQEKLQKNMIESQKLLQPLVDMQDSEFLQIFDSIESCDATNNNSLLNSNQREKIRNSAQAVLLELNAG